MLRLALISLHIILALFVFQSGFLLKRQEIVSKSRCEDANGGDGSRCWMTPQYKRVILIVIDALRHDFMMPLDLNTVIGTESNYRGQMKLVEGLILREKAAIGTLLADPPTTTLQRIKALTTGTLPTFIDAGENFSPESVVNEDSFLSQAHAQGLNITLLGDDTWLSLYPRQFVRSVAFDSFDINDLNSVDDAIRPVLAEEMANSDSSIIIAHFLGVDHCGHKYGPKHAVMRDMLRKMDKIVSETVESLRDDDILMVIGDHGMTGTGDHGGDSEDEVKAGIMVATKKKKLKLPSEPMRQIDMVPTVSLLLGLPIPFSNLGTVILDLFEPEHREAAVAMNYEQVKRFAETYAQNKGFGDLHQITAREVNTIEEQLQVMSRIQTTLRAAWTQFDSAYINIGIMCLIEAVLFLVSSQKMSIEWIIFRSGCVLLQFALLSDHSESEAAHTLLTMALTVSCLSSLFSITVELLKIRWSSFTLSSSHCGVVAVILHSTTLFSNSFVVYEAQVTRYLIQSMLVIVFVERIRSMKIRPKTISTAIRQIFMSNDALLILVAMCCVRIEPYFHRCREEEIGCEQQYPAMMLTALSTDAQFWRIMVSAIALYSLNFLVLRKTPKTGISDNLKVIRASTWPLLSLVIFYSLLQTVQNSIHMANVSKLSMITAQVVYGMSILMAVVAFMNGHDGRLLGLHISTWPFYLLLGDGLQPALVLLLVLIYVVFELVPRESLPSLICLLVPFGFYLTGHSPVISSIPWTAAFIGIPGHLALRILPATLVISHLSISAILPVLGFSILVPRPHYPRRIVDESLVLMTIRSIASCGAASLHRRHLMVWKIFAPKFIFENVLFIVFVVCINVIYSLFLRGNLKSSDGECEKKK